MSDHTKTLVILGANGSGKTSFANFLRNYFENTTKRPCLIIGGAFGLDSSVCNIANDCLSLGNITFPI